jgi:hypothetical protein
MKARENPRTQDVSLFIGCLPGEDTRRVMLFPEGRVIATVQVEQVQVDGYEGPDRGASASGALIQLLLANGWYIEQMDRPTSVWLKPGPLLAGCSGISIKGMDVSVTPPS